VLILVLSDRFVAGSYCGVVTSLTYQHNAALSQRQELAQAQLVTMPKVGFYRNCESIQTRSRFRLLQLMALPSRAFDQRSCA
jgi:hypothetical protein